MTQQLLGGPGARGAGAHTLYAPCCPLNSTPEQHPSSLYGLVFMSHSHIDHNVDHHVSLSHVLTNGGQRPPVLASSSYMYTVLIVQRYNAKCSKWETVTGGVLQAHALPHVAGVYCTLHAWLCVYYTSAAACCCCLHSHQLSLHIHLPLIVIINAPLVVSLSQHSVGMGIALPSPMASWIPP